MVIKCRVNRSFSKARRNNAAHVTILRNAGNFGGYVFPGPAAVARDLKIAVVGSRVKQALLERRFGDRDYRAVAHHAVMPREHVPIWKHAHYRELISVLVLG